MKINGIPFAAPPVGPPMAGLPDWPAVSKDAALTMEVGEAFRAIPIAATQPRVEFFRRFVSRP
jgi:hypothetical protein